MKAQVHIVASLLVVVTFNFSERFYGDDESEIGNEKRELESWGE